MSTKNTRKKYFRAKSIFKSSQEFWSWYSFGRRSWNLEIRMFRKKYILYILWFFLVWNALFYAYGYNTQDSYREYSKLFEYRRLHPDFQPNTDIIRFTVAGHTTTYADTIWIWLIQYIGDNVINGKYKDFSNPLIRNIIKIHPYFPSPYNLSLILSPNINRDKPGYEKNIPIGEDSLEIGEKGITLLCDQEKIKKIEKIDFSTELWENPTIENPCSDSMIAYNTAYVAQELLQNKKAVYYYKIAVSKQRLTSSLSFLGPPYGSKRMRPSSSSRKDFCLCESNDMMKTRIYVDL